MVTDGLQKPVDSLESNIKTFMYVCRCVFLVIIANSRRWWTEKPEVLQFMGSQRVGHD